MEKIKVFAYKFDEAEPAIIFDSFDSLVETMKAELDDDAVTEFEATVTIKHMTREELEALPEYQ